MASRMLLSVASAPDLRALADSDSDVEDHKGVWF